MAYKKSSKMQRTSKIEPSVQTLYIGTQTIGVADTAYLDLSQVASLINRRFYRQGINWAVAGFKVLSQPTFSGSVGISKLPNTWVMANSWEKSMRAWMRMNKESLSETESVRPRFLILRFLQMQDIMLQDMHRIFCQFLRAQFLLRQENGNQVR